MERKSEERTTSELDFARNLIQVDSLSQKFTAVMREESTSVYGVGYVKTTRHHLGNKVYKLIWAATIG
ncbi:MAG: hypothetical protein RLZZ143_2418 [Cyanobacteriota bacterium]|jgi:hypothetical protein